MEKTPTLGSKIDLVFTVIRLGLFFSDADLIARNVDKAQWYLPQGIKIDVRLIDSGGDWDRRNRLKAYNGIYLLSIRSFSPAADLLLDVLSTFTSTELMEFEDVVMYAVLAGSISLSRVDLKTKVPLNFNLPDNRSLILPRFYKFFPIMKFLNL
jgi:26S proteasome regulatory subunit N7